MLRSLLSCSSPTCTIPPLSPGIVPKLEVPPLENVPNYGGDLQPQGDLQIEVLAGTVARVNGTVTGLDPSSFGTVAIWSGPSCADLGDPLTSPMAGDATISQRFPTSSTGDADVSTGGMGFPISSLLGRPVVVEDAQGTPVACALTPIEAPGGDRSCLAFPALPGLSPPPPPPPAACAMCAAHSHDSFKRC